MTKVTLRQKPISQERQSLYLDYYPPIPHPETGKPTRREFLGLYLFDKAKNAADKLHNTNTKQLAENIRARRQIAVQNKEYDFLCDYKRQACFIQFFSDLTEKRKTSEHDNWTSTLQHLKEYVGETIPISSIDTNFCEDFKDYLLTAPNRKDPDKTIAQNTALSYFNRFRAALTVLYDQRLLKEDLKEKVDNIDEQETQREFLYLEELQTLAAADYPESMVLLRKAALFSALTGLRHSDIKKLTWEEIRHEDQEGYAIHFRQKKTSGLQVLPISDEAYCLLGTRGGDKDRIFEGLVYSYYNNQRLAKWVENAGIKKRITFHCFRHTFATIQLRLKTDIYTVSKMLGHKFLSTTQVYAKVVDETKREAATKISLDKNGAENETTSI